MTGLESLAAATWTYAVTFLQYASKMLGEHHDYNLESLFQNNKTLGTKDSRRNQLLAPSLK